MDLLANNVKFREYLKNARTTEMLKSPPRQNQCMNSQVCDNVRCKESSTIIDSKFTEKIENYKNADFCCLVEILKNAEIP